MLPIDRKYLPGMRRQLSVGPVDPPVAIYGLELGGGAHPGLSRSCGQLSREARLVGPFLRACRPLQICYIVRLVTAGGLLDDALLEGGLTDSGQQALASGTKWTVHQEVLLGHITSALL